MLHRICASLLCTLRVPHRIVSHCSLSSYVFQNLFPVYSHAFILGIPCAPFATLGLGLRAQRLTCISSRTLLHIPCPQSSARALYKDRQNLNFLRAQASINIKGGQLLEPLIALLPNYSTCLFVGDDLQKPLQSPCSPWAALHISSLLQLPCKNRRINLGVFKDFYTNYVPPGQWSVAGP